MPRIDSRSSQTIHLTADEFATLGERVRTTAPSTELAMVLAEAEPTEAPLVEHVMRTEQRVLQDAEGNERTIEVQVPDHDITYHYAITVPPENVQLVQDALRSEGHHELAEHVATPASVAPTSYEANPSGLILPS